MRLTCNIDQRGRKARIIAGVFVDLFGSTLIVVGVFARSLPTLAVGIILCVTGSFMIFEGARGWCALRALGIKTKL